MQKSMLLKLGGFVTALCATGALVAVTVPATGAYFSDSKPGSITATSGHLTLATSDLNVNFDKLMPGVPQAKSVDYRVNADSGTVDVWLVFDTTARDTVTGATTAYHLFTGGGSSPSGLGRYGYFQVADTHGGVAFTSGNLKFADATDNDASDNCGVDLATGRGGNGRIYDGVTDYSSVHGTGTTPPLCGAPSKILLASDLADGVSGTVTLTFGLNGLLQTTQGQYEGTVPFSIVATQHGAPLP